jgi:hypothetical protein
MTRILLVAAIALGLIVPAASAQADPSKKHHHHHRAFAGRIQQPYVYGPWQAPAGFRRHGPPWARPNECFHDEGYGRWSPCGGRFD